MVALGLSVFYAQLPADGGTGDLESLSPEGYRVQWLLEERPGGLRTGDVIVQAGGYDIDDWLSGVPRTAEWHTGQVIDYQVVRDGEPLKLAVSLRPIPFRAILARWTPQWLGAVAFFLIGTLVFWRRPNDLAARLLMFFCTTVALQYWGDAYNLQFSALSWRWPFWLHVIYEHAMYSLGIATICYFALVFPIPHPLVIRFPRGVPFVLYISHLVVITTAMALSPARFAALSTGSRASWFLAMLQMGLAITAGFRSVRTARDPVTRAQMRWIVWSISLGAALLVPGYVLPLAFGGRPLLSHPVAMILTTALPMSFAVAILRYRLFDIEIVINRSLVYGTLTVLLAGLYLLLVRTLTLATQWVLHRENDTLVVFIATLSIALAFAPLRRSVQRWIDRALYRTRPDYQRLLAETSAELATSLVLDELVSLLTEWLPRQLQITWTRLAILDPGGEQFVRAGSADHCTLHADHPVPTYLRRGHLLVRLQLPSHLPAEVAAFLAEREIEACIPLTVGGELVGIYDLGAKRSGDPYNHDEVRLLRLVGQQAAIAVENSRLFQAEREQRQMTEALASAVSVMGRTLHLGQVMKTIAQGIVDRLDYDWVLASRYLEEAHTFTGLALYPVPASERLDQLLHLVGHPEWRDAPAQFELPYQPGQNPLVDRVLQGETVVSDSLTDFFQPWVPRPASFAVQKLFGMQSFVDVPVRIRDKTVGTILAGVRQAPIAAAQQQALVRVAGQAAIAIENAQLYERAQQEIDERLQAEARLRRTNSNLEAMIENTDEYILISDANALPIRFNSAYAQVMREAFGIEMRPGLKPHTLIPDQSVVAWWDGLHRRVLSGEKFRTEYSHEFGPGEVRHFEILYNPIIEGDQVVGFTEFTRDITERKRAEAAVLKASLMDATATLAGGIAHRINNLMTGVVGNAELLQIDLIDRLAMVQRRDAGEMLASISQSAQEASHLAGQMLAFARGGKYQPRPMNLNDTVREVLRLHLQEYALPPNVYVDRRLALDLWEIGADATQMSQMFFSLLANAIEAVEGFDRATHRITITTRNVMLNEAFRQQARSVHPHPDIEPGAYVCLSVQDTGVGMSESVVAKLFEPFFSTKFQGRGLGLAATYGIVRNHNGHILVRSREARGSTFEIYFPAQAGPMQPGEAPSEVASDR